MSLDLPIWQYLFGLSILDELFKGLVVNVGHRQVADVWIKRLEAKCLRLD